MAAGLQSSIKNNAKLAASSITATNNSDSVTITSLSKGNTTYSTSVSGKQTEQLTSGALTPPYPTHREFYAQATENVTRKVWGGNQSPDHYLVNPDFACTQALISTIMTYGQVPGRELADIGGTISAGDILSISINDSSLSPNPQPISYQEVAGDTFATVGAGLAKAINDNSNLSSNGISATSTATSTAAVVTIKAHPTTGYSPSSTGPTTLKTIALAWPTGQSCPSF